MPITDLDQPGAMAFLAEVTSARNLLAYGVRSTRTAAFTSTTLDPILTMLSIGVEKLYKLTLGVARLDREGAWPCVEEMKRWGHNLVRMHDEVMSELHQRTMDKSPYVRGLVTAVGLDPVIPPLLGALDAYGQMGRFYYLDLLGGQGQAGLRPDEAWDRVTAVARSNSAAESLETRLIDDNNAWREYRGAINERIAGAIEGIWTTIVTCGRSGVLGDTGTYFGFEIHPHLVGNQ